MRPPILLLIFLAVMIPVIYVLFFTPLIDKLLLKLRFGRSAKSISHAAEAFDNTVRDTSKDLQAAVDELDAALKTVGKIEQRPLSQKLRTTESHPWLIVDTTRDNAFWSNTFGWVDRSEADLFSEEEKRLVILPISGRWFKSRKKSVRNAGE